MTKVNVTTIGAIIDGKPLGSVFEMGERQAKKLAGLGYVTINESVTPTQAPTVKKESAPKKPEAKVAKGKADTKK